MGARSVAKLSPFRRSEALLSLRFYVPLDALGGPQTVRILLNGSPVDHFTAATPQVERLYTVHPRSEGHNELVIETGRVVNPKAAGRGSDPRDLGLRLDGIGWSPGKE